MKFPRVILEVDLLSKEKAAVMSDGKAQSNCPDHVEKIRIVQTGERLNLPICVCEKAGEPDAMGNIQWHKAELPWQILLALYGRKVSAIVKSHEERCAEVVQCVKDAMTGTRGDEMCITEDKLESAVDRGLAKWRV